MLRIRRNILSYLAFYNHLQQCNPNFSFNDITTTNYILLDFLFSFDDFLLLLDRFFLPTFLDSPISTGIFILLSFSNAPSSLNLSNRLIDNLMISSAICNTNGYFMIITILNHLTSLSKSPSSLKQIPFQLKTNPLNRPKVHYRSFSTLFLFHRKMSF